MEKSLKKKRKPATWITGIATDFIDLILKEQIISGRNIKDLIVKHNDIIGASNDPSLVIKSYDKFVCVLENFIEIVPDDLTKIKGRKQNLISLKKEFLEEEKTRLTEEILKTIEIGYTDPRSRKRKIEEKAMTEEKTPAPKEKTVSKPRKESNIRVNTLTRIIDTLLWLVQNNSNSVRSDVVAKVAGIKKLHLSTIKTWEDSLSKHGIFLNACYLEKEGKLLVRDARNCLLSCCDLYRRISGEEPDSKYRSAGVVAAKKASVTNKIIGNSENGGVYYYTAGIIADNSFAAVNVDLICKSLIDLGYEYMTRYKLRDILKERPEFLFVQHGEFIGLEEKQESWELIREEFDPEKKKKWVDCRLPLSLVEVKRYFPETEELSMISERDGFYRIYYSESHTSSRIWYRLVTSFIGKDNIEKHIFDIDGKLINQISHKINDVEKILSERDLGYRIENL